MMKKLVALLMALALLCTSIGAFATGTTSEPAAPGDEAVQEEAEIVIPKGYDTLIENMGAEGQPGIQCPGHKRAYENTSIKQEMTCTDDEIRYFVCGECGKPFTVTTKTKGHQDPEEGAQTGYAKPEDAPVCYKDGTLKDGILTHYYCGVCEQRVEWTTTVKAEHSFGEGKKVDATCTTPEAVVYTCIKCGYEKREEVKGSELGHVWERAEKDPEFTYDPTYKENYSTATCAKPGTAGKVEVCVCGETRVADDMVTVDSPDHQDFICEQLDDVIADYNPTNGYAKLNTKYQYDEDKEYTVDAVAEGKYEDVTDDEGNAIVVKLYGALNVKYVAPTCTEDGSIVVTCKEGCGATFSAKIEALGHDYGNGTALDDAGEAAKDCTKVASKLYVCSRCDDRFIVAATPTDHAYTRNEKGEITTAPEYYMQQKVTDKAPVKITNFTDVATCLPYDAYIKCPKCDHYEVVHKPATKDNDGNLVHRKASKNVIMDTQASCTVDGKYIYICKDCGLTETDTRTAQGHDWVVDLEKSVAPTCKKEGIRVSYCSKCEVEPQEETLPMIDHIYQSTGKVDAPSCKEKKDGVDYQRCIMCGEAHEETIEWMHTKPAKVSHVDPDCEHKGYDQYECTVCGDLVTDWIEPTGHSWEYTNNTISDDPDDKIGVEAFMAEHEETCGGLFASDVASGDNYKCVPATCKAGAESGTKHVVYCTECGKAATKEWVSEDKPTMHSMVDENGVLTMLFSVDYKNLPTCSKPGKASYTCTVCGELVQDGVLPALGHNYQAVYDDATGAYKLVCTAIKNNDQGKAAFNALVANNKFYSENPDITAKVKAALFSTGANEEILGFGCGAVDEIDIKKTNHAVAIDAENGYVSVKLDAECNPLTKTYITVCWNLQNEAGEILSYTRSFNTYETKTDGTMVFDIGEFAAEGYDLVAIAAVVTDARYNKLEQAQESMYGAKVVFP